jgi:hypothetical protein
MNYFIMKGEWVFALVKGATLVAGWATLAWYARTNLAFVRKVAYMGSVAYLGLWLCLFFVYN